MPCGCNSLESELAEYPLEDGPEGTRETLKRMRELVRAGKRALWSRQLAHAIVAHVPAKDWIGEIRAVFDFVRSSVRYSLDPNGIEFIQRADKTLGLGAGDCDDMAVLTATLCEQLGHAAAFCALGFDDSGEFSHVVVWVSGAAGETPVISLDPTENRPMGWFPPGATCLMVAPIEEGMI